jgi:transposase
LDLVKRNTPERACAVDDIIRDAGHVPIRLPPYHCYLNPIEFVWAQMKKFISKHNLNNNKEQIKELILKSLNEITPENWKNYIRHCGEFEKNHW